MKAIIMRLVAVLLVLSCAVALFGCESEETTSGRRRSKRSSDENETVQAALEEQTEGRTETQPAGGQEAYEEEAAAEQANPGSKKLPAIELFDMTYGQLSRLSWEDTDECQDYGNGTWGFRAYENDAWFVFIFQGEIEDQDAVAQVLTVDGFESKVYITSELRLNKCVEDCSSQIRNNIEVMDGGWVCGIYLDGYYTQLMFFSEEDEVEEAYLINAQFQREGR